MASEATKMTFRGDMHLDTKVKEVADFKSKVIFIQHCPIARESIGPLPSCFVSVSLELNERGRIVTTPLPLSVSLSGRRPRPLIVISQRQVINWHAIYGGVSRHLIEMRGRRRSGGLSDPITPSLLVSLFFIFLAWSKWRHFYKQVPRPGFASLTTRNEVTYVILRSC